MYELVQSLKRLVFKWKYLILAFIVLGLTSGYYKSTRYVPFYSSKLIATSKTLPSAVVIKSMRSLNKTLQAGKITGVTASYTLEGGAANDFLEMRANLFEVDEDQLSKRGDVEGFDFFEISIQYTGSFKRITTFIKAYIRSLSQKVAGDVIRPLVIISDFQHSGIPVNTKYAPIYLGFGIGLVLAIVIIFILELYQNRGTSALKD